MAKNSSSRSKKASNVGKGKVTPVQIAFIIERFLADNNYTNTIIAFRDEASDLFSKTRSKEVPKGLLGLADILDEYISLKEQRMAVDQEKRRVEMAFQGMNDVMRIFHSAGSPAAAAAAALPPSLLPPAAATPTGSLTTSANPTSSGSPPGHAIHGSFLSNCQQLPNLPVKVAETNKFSTPVPNVSSSGKRKASKNAANAPPPPKKCRTQPSTNSHKTGGATTSARVSSTDYTKDNTLSNSTVQPIPNTSIEQSHVQGHSVAKSLFIHPPEFRANSSSPKTPPQPLDFQNDNKPSTPLEKLPLSAIGSSSTSQKIASSNCSVISSERIIISPLKHKAYYTVERSYRVTSPLKPNSERMIKRDQVKGRLDFDQSLPPEVSEELVATDSSPSTTNEETPGSFDFDLPDFDFLDGDLSRLLVDMDIECERMFPCQQSSNPADSYPGMEQRIGDGCLVTDQTSPECCPSTLTEIISHKDMDIRGSDTITSMRSITKCIQITSPAKGRKCCSPEQTDVTS